MLIVLLLLKITSARITVSCKDQFAANEQVSCQYNCPGCLVYIQNQQYTTSYPLGSTLPSGYYSLVVRSNTDVGVSNYFAVSTISQASWFVSPLQGAYWPANSLYRIRYFSTAPIQLLHLDLLTPQGLLVSRILEYQTSLADDELLGSPLAYVLWRIPRELANRKFRLSISNAATNATFTSGIFTVG
jgi:hypothetical protein